MKYFLQAKDKDYINLTIVELLQDEIVKLSRSIDRPIFSIYTLQLYVIHNQKLVTVIVKLVTYS